MLSVRSCGELFLKLAVVAMLLFPGVGTATTVRMQTSLGDVDIQLLDSAAPATVANFLNYVNSGAYNNSFIHRSIPGFVVQGGGFAWSDAGNGVYGIATNAPVVNEFSSSRSNVRGTIAMAKVGGDPNSATSQWFFNLADNSANLDSQSGGFTVFGQVVGNGMAVIDAIAALYRVDAGSPFDTLPLAVPTTGTILKSNLVMVNNVSVLPGLNGIWTSSGGSYLVLMKDAGSNTAIALDLAANLSAMKIWIGSTSGASLSLAGIANSADSLSATAAANSITGTRVISGASASYAASPAFSYVGSAYDGIWQKAGAGNAYFAYTTVTVSASTVAIVLDVTLNADGTVAFDVISGTTVNGIFDGTSLLNSGKTLRMTVSGTSASGTYAQPVTTTFTASQVIMTSQ